MSDIFLSYAREDDSRIQPLVKALVAQGWSVWWDRQIASGQVFDRVIEEALAQAKCVIVVWSGHSVDSSWVRAEADDGLRRKVLIPVLIDAVRPPLAFRQIQGANLVGWMENRESPEFLKLVADIERILGARQSKEADVRTVSAGSEESASVLPHYSQVTRRRRRILVMALTLMILLVLGWLLFREPVRRLAGKVETRTGAVSLTATLAPGGSPVKGKWTVYDASTNALGERKQIAYGYDQTQQFRLSPGRYRVQVTCGAASADREIVVEADRLTEAQLLLDAGRVELTAVLAPGGAPIEVGGGASAITGRWTVYTAQATESGERKEVTYGYDKYQQFVLPTGHYRVQLEYDAASAVQEIQVLSGKSTEAQLVLNAGRVELTAVLAPGGTPIEVGGGASATSGSWTVYEAEADELGDRKKIAHGYAQYQRFILPAGRYRAEVKYGTVSAFREISVRAGKLTKVDLVLPSHSN